MDHWLMAKVLENKKYGDIWGFPSDPPVAKSTSKRRRIRAPLVPRRFARVAAQT
jgi:hypothetical protein